MSSPCILCGKEGWPYYHSTENYAVSFIQELQNSAMFTFPEIKNLTALKHSCVKDYF